MNEDNIKKEERDNFTVVLEDLRSDFKMFGEALNGFGEKLEIVRKKGDATFEEVGKILLRLDNIENEIKSLRKDFDLIKEELKDKVSMDHLKQFEERLLRVEKKLELSST